MSKKNSKSRQANDSMPVFKFTGYAPYPGKELAERIIPFLVLTADPAARLNHTREPADTDWLPYGDIIESYQIGTDQQGLRVSEEEEWAEPQGVPGVWSRTLDIESYGLPDNQYFKLHCDTRPGKLSVEFLLQEPNYEAVLQEINRTFHWTDSEEPSLVIELQELGTFGDVTNLTEEIPLHRDLFKSRKVSEKTFALLEKLLQTNHKKQGIYLHLQLILLCAAERFDDALARIEDHRTAQRKVKHLATFEGYCLYKQQRFADSLKAYRGEKDRTNAWYWLMLELLFAMEDWQQYISVLEKFAATDYELRGSFSPHGSSLLQADAYSRFGDKQAAIRMLKRGISLNPFSSYNDVLGCEEPEFWWLPFRVTKWCAALRGDSEFNKLIANPFRQMHGWYTDAVAALSQIPPFEDDWDVTLPFEQIDLTQGDNTRKELEAAYQALNHIQHYPPYGQPYVLLRKAVILAKLNRLAEAKQLTEEIIAHHQELELAKHLLNELQAHPA